MGSEGQIFTYQPLTQTTQCTDNNNNTRVFDVIPATGSNNNNIINSNKVTKETCVLDSKGKCRRKINIKRAGPRLSQSAEFKSWLDSFIVRSPEKFKCAHLDQ